MSLGIFARSQVHVDSTLLGLQLSVLLGVLVGLFLGRLYFLFWHQKHTTGIDVYTFIPVGHYTVDQHRLDQTARHRFILERKKIKRW